jgi:hypothetical protein
MSSHFGEATSSIKDLERRNSMTRREEIAKATKECKEDYVGLGRHLTSNDIADAFEEGAKWADKTMIEKACKWLINIDFDDFHFRCTDETFDNDVFVDAFRKVMEK